MKKEKKHWNILGKFRSIQNTIFVLTASLVLFAVITVTVISLNFTRSSIFENTVTYNRQLTGQVNADIDSYISYMENISSMLAENLDVKKYLFGEGEEADEAGVQLLSQFSTVLSSREDIYNLGILQKNGKALLNEGKSRLNTYVDMEKQE